MLRSLSLSNLRGMAGAVVLWITTVVVGLVQLLIFETAPGESNIAPARWPAATTIDRAIDHHTLVMFLHPHCPCSNASLNNLQTVMSRLNRTVALRIVLVRPPGCPEGWEDGALLHQLQARRDLTLYIDNDGVEAKRFGAQTSGHVLLYDPSARLVFTGGITPQRGHEGQCHGADAVANAVNYQPQTLICSQIYGCPLFSEMKTPGSGTGALQKQ